MTSPAEDEVLYPKLPTAATPQAPPRAGRRVVLDDLVELLRQRSEFGERKYGTKLETFNGRDPYLDALQELLDLFVYLHQAQMERADLEARARSSVTGWKFCPWCGDPVSPAARCFCRGWTSSERGLL